MTKADIKIFEKSNRLCIYCNQLCYPEDSGYSKTKRGTVNVFHDECVKRYGIICAWHKEDN